MKVIGDGGDELMTGSKTAEWSVDNEQRLMYSSINELSHVGRDCQLTLKLTGHSPTLTLTSCHMSAVTVNSPSNSQVTHLHSH